MELIDFPKKFGNEDETRALCQAISTVELTTLALRRNTRESTAALRADTAARFEMVKLINQMAEKAGRWDYILNLMPELEDKLNGTD